MNPAYINEAALDVDEVDPTNLAPLVSGNASIVTVPASEDENIVEDLGEDIDEDEEMQDILDKAEKLDTEVNELRKEIMDLLSSIHEERTLTPISLLRSYKLMFGTQGRLGSKNTDCTLIRVLVRSVAGCLTRFGICSKYYRSGLTSEPVIIKILS